MLDKALRIVELLFALRSCPTFRAAPGHVCDPGLAQSLARDVAACCAPDGASAERLVPVRLRRRCAALVQHVVRRLSVPTKPPVLGERSSATVAA